MPATGRSESPRSCRSRFDRTCRSAGRRDRLQTTGSATLLASGATLAAVGRGRLHQVLDLGDGLDELPVLPSAEVLAPGRVQLERREGVGVELGPEVGVAAGLEPRAVEAVPVVPLQHLQSGTGLAEQQGPQVGVGKAVAACLVLEQLLAELEDLVLVVTELAGEGGDDDGLLGQLSGSLVGV